jgi:hypothetical protein
MFSLKLNLLFAGWKDAKEIARKFNRPRQSELDPRELHRMRSELRLAREQARLMSVIYRNRIL